MDFQSILPFPKDIMMDLGRVDKRRPKDVHGGGAGVVLLAERQRCKLLMGVSAEQMSPILDGGDGGRGVRGSRLMGWVPVVMRLF